MRILCPGCYSANTARRHRYGLLDNILPWFNRWPYRCLECGRGFHASQRYPSQAPYRRGEAEGHLASTRSTGPQMAYAAMSDRPVAKIVLQADTHCQMNRILQALSWAVESCRHPVNRDARGHRSAAHS